VPGNGLCKILKRDLEAAVYANRDAPGPACDIVYCWYCDRQWASAGSPSHEEGCLLEEDGEFLEIFSKKASSARSPPGM